MNKDNTEYIYSETKVNTQYSQSLQIDELIKLANVIWTDVKSNKKQNTEEMFDVVFNKYREFGSSFPIILRWMVEMDKFSDRAFKKFLYKYSNTDITNKKDFLIVQAEYLVYLYEETKHYDKNQVNLYREFIIKQLLEEDKLLSQMEEETKKELEKLKEEKRKELYEYVKSIKK